MDLFIIIMISWFVVGLISVILLFAIDLRGKPYNERYFEDKLAPTLFVFVFGYFSLLFVVLAYNGKKKFLQKTIYRIVNIGVKTTNGAIKE